MEQLVPGGTPLQEVVGIGEKTADKLIERGITTVERLGEMTPEQLQEIPGIGPKMVEKIRLAVNNYYAQFEEGAPEAGAWPGGPMDSAPATAAGTEKGPKGGVAADAAGNAEQETTAPEKTEKLDSPKPLATDAESEQREK